MEADLDQAAGKTPRRNLWSIVKKVWKFVGGGALLAALFVGWIGLSDFRFAQIWGSDEGSAKEETTALESFPEPAAQEEEVAAASLTSDGPTTKDVSGMLALSPHSSEAVHGGELRISASSIYSPFANISGATELAHCEETLDVGQSVVMSNRAAGAIDYSRWYVATLIGITDRTASIEWSTGTGAAPTDAGGRSCA